MNPHRTILAIPLLAAVLAMAGCATLPDQDPLEVTVAGIEPLQGEGMELRMNVRLRVQNPNDSPLDYDGVSVKLEVQGRTFATGVSDATGTVPRFGESVIEVPVTASMLRVVRNVVGMMQDEPPEQVRYRMTGKLSLAGFGSRRFSAEGEFRLPAGTVREEVAPSP
jgi:LEA14-like dessication related protein